MMILDEYILYSSTSIVSIYLYRFLPWGPDYRCLGWRGLLERTVEQVQGVFPGRFGKVSPDFVNDAMGEKAVEGGLAARGEQKNKITTPCLPPMR